MKVSGTYVLHAPRERAWQLLNDPAFLKACLPGCESLEATGPDQYQAALTVGLAAVKGKYTGTVTLSEKQPPERFTMQVQGRGSAGFLQGTGTLELAPEGDGTRVNYQGDVQVGGPIAGVGQRLLDGAAKMLVGQFFTAMDTQLEALAKSSPSQSGPGGPQTSEAPNAQGSAPPPGAQGLAPAPTPVPISPWRTLVRLLWTQGKARLRRWFG